LNQPTAGATDAPLLEIVIVSAAGGRELLRACLESINRHPLRAGRSTTWVVDSASADGTVQMVDTEFPWVKLVALPTNRGFCVANNIVLRQATGPYVLLLNPDTELSSGALDGALRTLQAHADAAVVGVRLVRSDGAFDHAAKRSFPTLVGAMAHFSGLGRLAESGPLAQYRQPDLDEHAQGEVDAVTGAFMLLRRSAMIEVGLLDEAYGMYGEDLDWCYRFKAAGWKVLYDGSTTVLHVKGGTSISEHGRARHRKLVTNIAFHRAMGRFYRKHHSGSNALVDMLVYLALGLKFVVSATRSASRGVR